PVLQLVLALVALVVVGLAREDENVGGRGREPRLDVAVVVACERREVGEQPGVVDDEETLPLAEPCRRRAPHGGDDALQRLARDRLTRVVPHHPAAPEDVAEVHQAYEISSSSEPSGSRK